MANLDLRHPPANLPSEAVTLAIPRNTNDKGKNATVPNVAVLKIGVSRRINLFMLFSLGLGMVDGYSLFIWRISLTTHILPLHFIRSSASMFGACFGLFLAVFHWFTLVCFRLKASHSKANKIRGHPKFETAHKKKYSEQQLEPSPLPMRFSWEGDITTMGRWEGFTSIIGYALMLAVSISFVPHFGGKKLLLTVNHWFFFFWLWILGFLWWSSSALSSVKLYLKYLNGVTPDWGDMRWAMPVNIWRESFWIDKSRKMLASYPNFVHGISSSCAPFPYSTSTMLFSSSRSLPPLC